MVSAASLLRCLHPTTGEQPALFDRLRRMTATPRFTEATVTAALGVAHATLLGVGAFGDTWRVDDTAVKIICVDGYPADRVAREVDGLRRVDSEHVVKLLDTGRVELGGKARATLTFEYVEGGDLAGRISDGERPPALQARGLLQGLLMGVRDMHAADGTVHRDIKPPNVALRGGDWEDPVLLDLGLAKSNTETTVTVYPGFLGTAFYMAPEQLKGQRAKKAADLFAVGVTVRHAITGEHPFYDMAGSYTYAELDALTQQPPRPLPTELDDDVREVLDILVSYPQHARRSVSSNLRRLGI
jgi:serine/threonine protein kinase